MKGRLLFIAIIVLGCSEEHETKKKLCSPFIMTISDAIPVQFWVNGVETFNQKEVCGITPACFCQPFNSTDEVRIQISDSEYNSFELRILDSSSTLITTLSFSEISENVHEISFVPSEIEVTNESVRLQIIGILTLVNEDFNSSINSWDNFSTGNDWTWTNDAGNGSALSTTTGDNTKFLRQQITILTDDELQISGEVRVVRISGSSELIWYIFNGSTVVFSNVLTNFGVSNTLTFSGEIIASSSATHLGFRALPGSGSHDIYMHNFNLELRRIVAYSDCVDIKESHDCTQLIRYDNTKDFAGIEYSSFSPTAEFYLRIPAIFFHERNTEEEENFEESSENIVRLRNEIKLKRLLEVGFMPDYMHRKLLLILAHDTIEIDGESWIKRDPYEKEEPGNRRYPLKKASVLLTQKDYIKRNIL